MLVNTFVKLYYFSFIGSFGLSRNLSSSMSVCGDVSDTLVSPVSYTHLTLPTKLEV